MTAIATVLMADTWGMHDVGAGWMVVMMGVMVLFWAAVILGIVWLVRGGLEGRRERRDEARAPTATQILERRFAEGAISVDDYRERREVIASGSTENGGRHEPSTEPKAEEGRTP
jgi:uncharacterized membrane protein